MKGGENKSTQMQQTMNDVIVVDAGGWQTPEIVRVHIGNAVDAREECPPIYQRARSLEKQITIKDNI